MMRIAGLAILAALCTAGCSNLSTNYTDLPGNSSPNHMPQTGNSLPLNAGGQSASRLW